MDIAYQALIPNPPNNRQPWRQACHPNTERHPVRPKKSSSHRSPPIYEEFCHHLFRPHLIYRDLLRLKKGEFKARKGHFGRVLNCMKRIGRCTIMCMMLIAALGADFEFARAMKEAANGGGLTWLTATVLA